MDGRPTWTDCDEAGDYVVPNVLSPRDLVFRPDNIDKTVPYKCRAISLVVCENSFISVSSSIHLQCVVAQSSLTRLCKTVNGTPMYGRRYLSLNCLAQIRVPAAFLTKPGILVLLRYRLRLNDATLSMSSLLVCRVCCRFLTLHV